MTMQDNDRADAELLSALMDGELAGDEEARALRRLQSEPALQRRWARFHAARAALAGGAAQVSPGFADRVAAARAEEPRVLAPGRVPRRQPAWLRPVAGLAIAASVALVAIGALSLVRDSVSERAPLTVADAPATGAGTLEHDTGAVAPVAVATPGAAGMAEQARLRQRLMLYLASHNDYADAGEMPMIISHGRLSGLNAGQ